MKETTIEDKQNGISLGTLERGLDVLNCFCRGITRLSLTEVAASTGLNASTAFRILATLEKRNYISRNPETKKYQLGSQIICLFSPSLEAFDLRPLAKPHLQQLFSQANESVSLYVVLDNSRVCLDRIETTHPLRRVLHIGDRLPLTRGAGGKVLLAWLPAEIREKIQLLDPAILPEELAETKRKGFAVSMGERENGVAAVAAPVFDANGHVIAALSMSGPIVRFSNEFIDEMIPQIVHTARNISLDLGYQQDSSCQK